MGGLAQQQIPYIRTYTVADGLPSMEVYTVFQDSRGMLWFGTDAGVCRYDGAVFETFTQRDGLPDNTIFGVFEDKHGRIWFRSYNGLLSWYDGTRIVQPTVNKALKEKLNGRYVLSMVLDPQDTLWIGFRGDCSWLKIPPGYTGVQQEYPATPARFLIREFGNGTFGYTSFLGKDGSSRLSTVLYQGPGRVLMLLDAANDGNFNRIGAVRLSASEVVVGVAQRRYIVRENKKILIKENQDVMYMTPLGSGKFLMSTGTSGAWTCGLSQDTIARYHHYLDGHTVSGYLRDHEGGDWLTTTGGGVKYIPFPSINQVYAPELAPGDRLHSMVYTPDNGIFVFSLKANSFKFDNNNLEKFNFKFTIKPDKFTCYALNGDALFLATRPGEYIYTLKTGRLQAVWDDVYWSDMVIHLGATVAIPYDARHFCVVSSGALYLVNVETARTSLLLRSIPERIYAMAHGRGDTLWLGGISRLWMYLPGRPPEDWSLRHPLLAQHIDALYADTTHGYLWIASRGSGLFRLGPEGVQDLHAQYPQFPLTCRAICGRDSTLWAATGSGIWEIGHALSRKPVFRVYNQQNGLPTSNIDKVYIHDSHLWGIGDNLVFSFNPAHYPHNPYPPRTTLKAVLCNGVPLNPAFAAEVEADQNTFRFILSGQSYKSMGASRFWVRMVGADGKLRETNQTEQVYYNLPPGSYVFSAYALNNDGIASPQAAEYRFTILPPVWRRWWFLTLAALLVLGVVGAFVRNYVQRVRLQESTRRRLAELEITALRAQMDPHFIFNAINSIYHFVLTGDRKASAVYVARFARLIRNVLEYAPLKHISLEKELDTLRLYIGVEQLRFAEPFDYEIAVDPALDPAKIQVVPLLIQPYVENAIWHGLQHKQGKGQILISLRVEGQGLWCVIEDNGVGRTKAAQTEAKRSLPKHSISGALNHRRLELLKELYGIGFHLRYADCHPANDDGETGTRVELCIPILQHE